MSNATVSVPVPLSGDGPAVSVSHLVGTKTVQLAGTFTRGTYDLLATQNGTSYSPVLSFRAGGPEGLKQTVSGSFQSVKLRAVGAVATSTVTCEISAESAAGENRFASVATLSPGAGTETAPIDTWALFPPTGLDEDVCLLCTGGFRGPLVVLVSMDGTGYSPLGSFRVDTVPEGAPAVLEFGPLSTSDKFRYVKLLSGVVTATTTVTIGGRVVAAGPTPSAGTEITLSQGLGSLYKSPAGSFVAEAILPNHEWLVDFSVIEASTIALALDTIVKSSATDSSPVSFKVYVGSTTPGNTTGGSVVATVSTSSSTESLQAVVESLSNPGTACLVQLTATVPDASHVAYARGTTINITG